MATYAGPTGQQAMSTEGTPAVVETPAATAAASGIADPAPLGLIAFGMTTLMLSAINSGWIGAEATTAVLALAIPFGGVAQLIAGLWAFRRGNTFAATAFCSYGAFWISYYLLVNFFAAPVAKANPGEAGQIIGLYLFAWALFTGYMFVASLAGTRAVQSVFGLLTLTFAALCIGEWMGAAVGQQGEVWHHIGGYLGIATAVAAMYTSFADVTNASFARKILPT